jgi:hypothetical protein
MAGDHAKKEHDGDFLLVKYEHPKQVWVSGWKDQDTSSGFLGSGHHMFAVKIDH